MSLKSDCITVDAPVSYKKFKIPNFATLHIPPRPREEGRTELPSIPLADVPNAAFVQLVEAWVGEMYSKHNQERPARIANG